MFYTMTGIFITGTWTNLSLLRNIKYIYVGTICAESDKTGTYSAFPAHAPVSPPKYQEIDTCFNLNPVYFS